MLRTLRFAVLFAAMLILFTVTASAQNTEPIRETDIPLYADVGSGKDELPDLWFVELGGAPTVDGGNPAQLKKEKDDFRANARAAGLNFSERFSFETLWHGMSIKLDRTQLTTLKRLEGVKAVYPIFRLSLPPAQASDPNLLTALAMTGADIAQTELGFTGKGIRVAVMDTGVDYDHKDLGGDGVQRSNSSHFPTARVVKGWDFVGDAYNADPTSAAYNPTPAPDAYPDDCNGHGSHVAGIIGANGGVKGVAPQVTFGAYRVFGCDGSTTSDIMLAAMERVLEDKMQVLNMSIGSSFQWPQYPTAQASNRLVNRGVVVVASIGNSGANGLYAASAPGVGDKVIGVASFDNVTINLAKFTVSPDNTAIGYANASGAPPAPFSGSLPLAKTGTPTTANDACNPLPAGSLTGKAVLIRRGTCPFYQKAFNAQSAGAAAVILYNNTSGRFSPTVAGAPPITIPVVAISDAEGLLINNRIDAGATTLTWTNQVVSFPNATGNAISSFSSYGLAPDLSLKPDLGAPGGFVRSTYPIEKGSYNNISGTSMSSPHVAGAVALLLQAKPHTPPLTVRTILQNSADPKPRIGTPAGLDNVHRQGAGMLDIDDAILATTKIEPGKLELGESQPHPMPRMLVIDNDSKWAVTYDLSHEAALATGPNTFTPTFLTDAATATFSASSVTVPPKGKKTVFVTITPPATLPDKSVYGGYIVFTPRGGGQVYRVPYAGFKGDYQSIVAMTPTTFGFPWLAKLTACSRFVGLDCVVGGTYSNRPSGETYSLVDGLNTPYIILHLDHQVQRLIFEIDDPVTGKPIHPFFNRGVDMEYVGRNSTATSFFAIAWDGTRIYSNGFMGFSKDKEYTKPVPDGQYVLTVKVLKALGIPFVPAHWETWKSPVITIDRP